MPVPPGTTKARKPTLLKMVGGTFKKDEANPNEPDAEQGAPDMPEYLDERQQAAWKYFVGVLAELGVLFRADAVALEALSCTYAQVQQLYDALREQAAAGDDSLTYETTSEKGPTVQRAKPEVQLLKELNAQLQGWLGRFGLTPADRGRVSAAKKPTNGSANPDDEFGA